MLCFRYYGGFNLLCFAQSEPVDFESTYKLASENGADEKGSTRAKDTIKKKDPSAGGKTISKHMGNKQNGYSSESESENECNSTKHRKKGNTTWQFLRLFYISFQKYRLFSNFLCESLHPVSYACLPFQSNLFRNMLF